MVHKKGTRRLRHASKKHHRQDVLSIPELRRAFEHIEAFVVGNLGAPKGELVSGLQAEWKNTFHKMLDKKDAEAYVDYVQGMHKITKASRPHGTRRHRYRYRGGGGPLAGAPLDYTTRPGLYIAPGINQGSYAIVPAYVDKGFWNPEPGHSYDPVPGQTRYPTHAPPGMGSNAVMDITRQSGGTKSRRQRNHKQLRQNGGNTILDNAKTAMQQFMMRPIPSSAPPSVAQDLQTMARGQQVGASPEASQPSFKYQMGAYMPQGQAITAAPIQTNLKSDLFTR
jgi:hypothetical protein